MFSVACGAGETRVAATGAAEDASGAGNGEAGNADAHGFARRQKSSKQTHRMRRKNQRGASRKSRKPRGERKKHGHEDGCGEHQSPGSFLRQHIAHAEGLELTQTANATSTERRAASIKEGIMLSPPFYAEPDGV